MARKLVLRFLRLDRRRYLLFNSSRYRLLITSLLLPLRISILHWILIWRRCHLYLGIVKRDTNYMLDTMSSIRWIRMSIFQSSLHPTFSKITEKEQSWAFRATILETLNSGNNITRNWVQKKNSQSVSQSTIPPSQCRN